MVVVVLVLVVVEAVAAVAPTPPRTRVPAAQAITERRRFTGRKSIGRTLSRGGRNDPGCGALYDGRRASAGSSRAARIAGDTPAMRPTPSAAPAPPASAANGTSTSHPWLRA